MSLLIYNDGTCKYGAVVNTLPRNHRNSRPEQKLRQIIAYYRMETGRVHPITVLRDSDLHQQAPRLADDLAAIDSFEAA